MKMNIETLTRIQENPKAKAVASLALERFGIWQAHPTYVALMARVTAENDAAFLVSRGTA